MSQTGTTANPIFTIGHSNHPLKVFLELLSAHGITTLADVRSAPYSRFNPHFNRDALSRALASHGIAYTFLGKELGGRVDDPSCHHEGRVSYERVARTNYFRNGIKRLTRGAEKHKIAIMCAEREPLDCHRTLLVAHALDQQQVRVNHVLADGGLESHAQTMNRLLARHDLHPKGDLLMSRDASIATAIESQAKRVAFVADKSLAGFKPGMS